ncbi:S66 peptidase family protein [Runella limosa]|uniref:S66 peptidase family protein n=1 Tax=Runella limosa TaxID=370978 RepID=UPI000411094A|nr:LD-carboxypeptidase [Runella limosa]
MQRRNFLQTIAATPALIPSLSNRNKPTLKPARLKAGDTVGLVCPAAPAYSKQTVQVIVESMQALGFKVKFGKRMWERYGYLAGKDADRAADLNDMFADPSVQAIICVHGGWGCARLLPLLDYDTIKKNPKVLLGYSDVTALLLGIYSQTGLVTFHGPVGAVSWNEFTVGYLKKVLIEGEAVRYENPKVVGDNLTQVADRIDTIVAGKAKGRLLGGNLTVLSHLLGSPYVPDWKGSLFFCEDVDEAPYRVDRMLTQLKLSGIFDEMSGFIFGKCTECEPGNGSYGSLTLEDLWSDHLQPAQKPAFSGSMIGHIRQKFTIPVGIEAEMDAVTGVIQFLEKAVV